MTKPVTVAMRQPRDSWFRKPMGDDEKQALMDAVNPFRKPIEFFEIDNSEFNRQAKGFDLPPWMDQLLSGDVEVTIGKRHA